jgi:hypothetical protein
LFENNLHSHVPLTINCYCFLLDYNKPKTLCDQVSGMAVSLRAKVEEQLSCAICLEHFKDPKVLSCQHTYCLECIARLDMTGNFLICPVCRAITEVGGGNEVMFKSLDIKVIK